MGGAFVGGDCVGGVCVGGVQRGGVKKGAESKKFNLSLSFVIPVNIMKLKSLPPLNYIICKSKGFFQFIFVFCNSCE